MQKGGGSATVVHYVTMASCCKELVQTESSHLRCRVQDCVLVSLAGELSFIEAPADRFMSLLRSLSCLLLSAC